MRARLGVALVATTLGATVLVAAAPASAFPGANGRIAFTSDRDGASNTEIYSMNPDGSNQTNLTHHPALDFDASWSPDGSRIAFASDRTAAGSWDVYAMNADGSNVVRLTTDPALDWTPSWSPDGSKIVFTI